MLLHDILGLPLYDVPHTSPTGDLQYPTELYAYPTPHLSSPPTHTQVTVSKIMGKQCNMLYIYFLIDVKKGGGLALGSRAMGPKTSQMPSPFLSPMRQWAHGGRAPRLAGGWVWSMKKNVPKSWR